MTKASVFLIVIYTLNDVGARYIELVLYALEFIVRVKCVVGP
jgi:hypothetical protein